ncbi:MAG: nuclear transport factor 2 family protein [Fulvivirga sp.]
MKKQLIITLLLIGTASFSQAQEEVEIEKAVLTYIENFFENKYEPMAAVMHPRLSKRGINPDNKLSDEYGLQVLKELMDNKTALPKDRQKNTVKDITIFKNVATARLDTGYPNMKWVEFIHLAKIDGKWLIMDVFWAYY